MISHASTSTRRGLVMSDLHVFARRSRAEALLAPLTPRMREVNWVVLNGDTFDFRWSVHTGSAATVAAADQWLRVLLRSLPGCEVRLLLGNHDCLLEFEAALTSLAEEESRFGWHRYWLRLGPSLFLHGDCANRWMASDDLEQQRGQWQKDMQRGRLAATAYGWADVLGLTSMAHRWHFPRERTIRRVAHHLDQVLPDWCSETTDCYFGHTHLPFNAQEHAGIRFHNTGSAIAHFGFAPQFFDIPANGEEDGDTTSVQPKPR